MRISDWSSDVCSSDLVRRGAQQHLALDQRLAHQAELVILEIAQTAMNELGGGGGGGAAEILLLAKMDRQPAPGRVPCDPATIDAPADDGELKRGGHPPGLPERAAWDMARIFVLELMRTLNEIKPNLKGKYRRS